MCIDLHSSTRTVCTLNEICANSDELFELNEGDKFYCQFDWGKYEEMQRVLRRWD